MARNIGTCIKKAAALFLVFCTAAALFPFSALAVREVGYMPGVTEEMTDPAFWSGLTEHPDELLASPEEIALINEAVVSAEGRVVGDHPAVFDDILDGIGGKIEA